MNKKEKSLRSSNGITLVALVVTIIVLIILAGVSISTIVGENGIITKAKEVEFKTELTIVAETINITCLRQRLDLKANEGSITYLRNKDIINDQNIVDVRKLLQTTTKYGNGSTTDIFLIEGDKLIYIDSNGNKKEEVQLNIIEDMTPSFITEWTVAENDIIMLPISVGHTGNNQFTVDWGDGSKKETIDDTETVLTQMPQHQYSQAGTYQIKIQGKCYYWDMENLLDVNPEQSAKLIKLVSWGETQAMFYSFSYATNLSGSIPSPSKNTFKNYKNKFDYLFYGCSSITSIPEDLFKNCTNITSFKGTFCKCTGVTNIPENLFANCPNVTSFEETFYNCTGITNIPENLFADCPNVTSFKETFSYCTGITNAPENLFASCSNVTSFERTFSYCTGITNIPENLFASCPNVTSFERTFYRCNNIETIHSGIFDNNLKVTNFIGTFYDLQKITSVIELWNRTTEGLEGTGCYGSCDSLDTTNIPSPWADSL